MVCDIEAPSRSDTQALFLLVPGNDDAATDAWLRDWEQHAADNRQVVDLGLWDRPHRNTWVNKLNLAIHRAGRPVVLVAHGLGCLAVLWWVALEPEFARSRVVCASFFAVPDVDRPGRDARLAQLGACPREHLPFPAWLFISPLRVSEERNTLRRLARDWGAALVEPHADEAAPRGLLGRIFRRDAVVANAPSTSRDI